MMIFDSRASTFSAEHVSLYNSSSSRYSQVRALMLLCDATVS